MMGRTHALLGAGSIWLLSAVSGAVTNANVAPLCAIAAFGALLPDLDASQSMVRSLKVGSVRPFAALGFVAHRQWGHRALLHSPVGLVAFAGLCVPVGLLCRPLPAAALWLGYASHLAGDACTRTGIPGWPNRPDRKIFLLPPRFRLVTGSPAEERMVPLFAVAVLLLLLSHYPPTA